MSVPTNELIERLDWYRRCLEDVQDRRVVRGLAEAKAGYDSALSQLRARVTELEEALRKYGMHIIECDKNLAGGEADANDWQRAFDEAPCSCGYDAALAAAGEGEATCPACYGKGLTDQDDRPGILLPAEECPRCRGTGRASVGRRAAGEGGER
jgi:hypothetical protein